MGAYVNPGNNSFSMCRNSQYYVDKSGIIRLTNNIINTMDRRIVVSRPRRFGKTMIFSMLAAYYSIGCDSYQLFADLNISSDLSFEKHLNKYNVICIDMQQFYLQASKDNQLNNLAQYISRAISTELITLYPNEVCGHEDSLADAIISIGAAHNTKFIFLIDEWDIIYRQSIGNKKLKQDFTEFLKTLFKSGIIENFISLVYMTGILPIPKHETQSGLNNFREYSMIKSGEFAGYIGFTENEVETLCNKFGMSFSEFKHWYDGYELGDVGSIFCSASVITAIKEQEVENYWEKTGSATELLTFMNTVDPLFQQVIKDLLLDIPVALNIDRKGIDLSDIRDLRTALTALVHLGYLKYNKESRTVEIPNREVATEFVEILSQAKNNPAYKLIERSRDLFNKTLLHNADAVAEIIEQNHNDFSSIISYNSENDLACVVLLSYLSLLSNDDYELKRELKAGYGYADIVYTPRIKGKIPIIIELKWNHSVDSALQQVKDRKYSARFKDYPSVLLVGISYEKDPTKPNYKKHTCVIEQVDMH